MCYIIRHAEYSQRREVLNVGVSTESSWRVVALPNRERDHTVSSHIWAGRAMEGLSCCEMCCNIFINIEKQFQYLEL